MILQSELSPLQERLQAMLPKIQAYAVQLKARGGYNDFETRLAWDCLRAAVGTSTICEWYEKYSCHDDHIETLAKRALRSVYKEATNA